MNCLVSSGGLKVTACSRTRHIAAYSHGDISRRDPTPHVFETHATSRHQSRLWQRRFYGLHECRPGGFTRKYFDEPGAALHRFDNLPDGTGAR